ncbi:hypothetical protein [Aliidiomarina soli]|uniref:Peptidase M41 domain-containing protein n=1 Tax=Aliidiomarina soli TaxID=1928574 RepID=A0A432WJZ7_9GAMM|nr:hypothetical protein [Aliidiomarina soli]RUO34094.1 hypothetical protein CWE14_06555 [Aliidiomarina soli]
MKMSSYRRKQLQKIGQHEVAHYIVARILGFEVGGISLKITHIHDGHEAGSIIKLYGGLSDISDVSTYLENRIIVLYAGVLGESIENGEVNNTYALEELHKGGKSDFDKVRELLQVLNNIKYPNAHNEDDANKNLDFINNCLWNKAAKLVGEEHAIITGLGSRLASEVNLVGDEFKLSHEEIDLLPSIQARFH